MSALSGKSILVTGGSGSFGHAFVRRALDDGARRVVIFSRGEAKQAEMRTVFESDPRLRFFLGDVRDFARVSDAMRGVDIVVHAAAQKRVESCEADPSEAVATNITGTLNVARAAILEGVAQGCFLSTDKAAAPNTLYGATKLCAERLWLGSNVYAAGTVTRLSATRYGNVIASTGSVVPLWRAQFAERKPLTITDVQMTRFWMGMDQAVELVVLALTEMRGGEVFVPKIGSAPVLDLARAIVEGSGIYAPGHIETGLRPGEKRHEMLISAEEARHTYDAGTHYVIEPEARLWGELPTLPFPLVASGFSYESDSNPEQLSVDTLRRMVA